MLKKTSLLILTLLLTAAATAAGRAPDETERQRDGLQGPVRRVRTETAKIVSKGGKVAEAERTVLETATYDMKGAKIDNAYFLAAGGSLTGKEVYKYDERGNIVEMTLHNADGSVMSKEKYDYEFDAMGNWTKMVTSIALVENGLLRFEPTEVTYRFISYFLDERVAQQLQPAAASAAPAATAVVNNAAPAPVKAAAAAVTPGAAQPKPVAAQPKQSAAAPRQLPPSVQGPAAQLSASVVMPERAAPMSAGSAIAPVVKTGEDLPPAVRKVHTRPVSGGVLNGKALSLPKPEYPETARRARAAGLVVVEVVIDVNGRVISAKATSGSPLLREVAERAAREARFTPALLTGQPVKVTGQINYQFAL